MAYKDPEKKKAIDKAYRERNREKKKAIDKAYRERNPEKMAAKDKSYRERNREKMAAKDKSYRERNPEKIASKNKTYRERNREREAAKCKAWRGRNPERVKVNKRLWRERNPEFGTEYTRRRRASKRNAFVPLTANEKAKLLILERTRQELQTETGRAYHLDHILPISHGGIHHPMNLRILDGGENSSKCNKLLPEAIALAPEHFRLYSERVSPERAWEFVRQLAAGLGLSEEDLDALITGKPLKSKPTLEDFML